MSGSPRCKHKLSRLSGREAVSASVTVSSERDTQQSESLFPQHATCATISAVSCVSTACPIH